MAQAENHSSPPDILKTNITFYDKFAGNFEKIPFKEVLTELFIKYSTEVSGKKVLDIGSGPGTFSLWMQNRGFSVFCVDPSKEMSRRCEEKGLPVANTSFEEFQSTEAFDQIVAISSLIHVLPETLPSALEKIYDLLADEGVLYINFLLGDSSGLDDPTQAGEDRYFSRLQKEEVFNIIKPFFVVIEHKELEVKRMSSKFLLLILKKVNTS